MRTKRTLLAIALGLCVALGAVLFTGCDNEREPGKPAMTPVTEGIFSCSADASHKMIVKFKADGTFYANDLMMQTAYQGKYEVVDLEVTYIDAGADSVVNWLLENNQKVTDSNGKWLIDENMQPAANKDAAGQKSVKAVKFFEMDGTTPFAVNDAKTDAQFYGSETPGNVVAYTEGKLHNVNLGGYTRTLSQDKDSNFGIENEIRNLLYELMPAELPAWAVQHNAESDIKLTVQDLAFKIYHNGFDDLASGLTLTSGTYTEEGGVYTLSNGGTLTLTEASGDYSAVYTKDGVTINLVKWKDAASAIATLTGNTSISAQGTSVPLTFTLTLYDDGSAVLSNNRSATTVAGTYTAGANGEVVLTMEGITVSESSYADGAASISLGGTIMGQSFTVTVTGEMEALVREVAYTFSASVLGGNVTLTAKLYADGTVEITGISARGTTVVDTGTWAKGAGLPTITLQNGTAAVSATSATDVKLTYHGNIGAGENDYELPIVLPKTVTIAFTGSAFSGAVALTCNLYSDGTCELIGNGTSVIDTGTWSQGTGLPTVTFVQGSGSISATSATDVKLTYTGTINPQVGEGTYELTKVNE